MRDQLNSTRSSPPPPNEIAGFRETYLHRFTDPEDRTSLEHLADVFFQYWMENANHMPELPESYVRAELRAVGSDLRELERFLTHVIGISPEVYLVSHDDLPIASLALELGPQVAQLAKTIEEAVGERPKRNQYCSDGEP